MGLFGFPLLLIPFAIYNIVVFLMPGVGFATPLAQVPLYSGAVWDVTPGEILVSFALLMLLCELIKPARNGRRVLVEHGLAFLLLIAATAEFIMVQQVASRTLFVLLAIMFVDAFGGVAVAIAMRRAQRALLIAEPEPAPIPDEIARPLPPAEPIVAVDPPPPVAEASKPEEPVTANSAPAPTSSTPS